jgi:regulator of sigma E protease
LDRNEHTQRPDDLNPARPPALPDEPEGFDDAEAASAEPPSLSQWLRVNGPMLVVVLAAVVAVCVFWDPWVVIKVGLGLGFIIFIHELGHFLVAKWCDVHVTTFSIGFGPALPFCSYTWGETTYKLAVFPLGGYVQMVGQVDGDESSDGSEDDPRSYKNKTVWQRMAIISAGVIMNAIFACIAFSAVFLGPGKPRVAAVVAAVDSGKPAFEEGLRTWAEIVKVNDIDKPYFEDLKFETMATLSDIRIETLRRGVDKAPMSYDITPHQGSVRMIGIQPAVRLQLAAKKAAPGFPAPVETGSAAAKASQPFEFDDVIVGVTDPDFPNDKSKMLLPPDPRDPDGGMKDFAEFQRRMTVLADKEVTMLVERGPEGHKQTVEIKVPAAFHRTLGVRMKMGQIVALRRNSEAAKLLKKPWTTDKGLKLEGDVIEEVEVTEPGAAQPTVLKKGVDLDPIRLPHQLKQWADRLWKATNGKPSAKERTVKLFVKRHSGESGEAAYLPKLQEVPLEWDYEWRYDRVLAMMPSSPEAIPELGLAYQVTNKVDNSTNSQLKKDDEIIDINFTYTKPDGTTTERGWETKSIKGAEWANLFLRLQSPEVAKVKLKIKRPGQEKEEIIELRPEEDKTWGMNERGLAFTIDSRTQRADNALLAIEMGFRDTYRSIVQVYLHLRGLIAGTISPENLGGPVAITTTAYRVAQYDFWEFVFFLGLISVNLAVLNFLPIPVLDGGHMVFLIYEKLRGKPASEGVRIGATYAGLLLLGCLMIFVLFLDIRRLVGG